MPPVPAHSSVSGRTAAAAFYFDLYMFDFQARFPAGFS